MDTLLQYISILNWIEPRFTLSELRHLKFDNIRFSDKKLKKLFLKPESLTDLYRLCDDIESSLKRGVNLLCCLDPSFPLALTQNIKHPCPIMLRGRLNFQAINLSVVGSRKPNRNSLDWLEGPFLQSLKFMKKNGKDINIMSGGAYGIDQKAHQMSLLSGVTTTCFLPSGINQCYPHNLEPMLHQIEEEGGCVLTPFPPNYPLFKSNFFYRNRILVLLSDIVFVVEARRRSGTMMTSNLAAKYGRTIIALPQPPHTSCMGGLDLIDSGAPMVRSKEDMVFQVEHSQNFRQGQHPGILGF